MRLSHHSRTVSLHDAVKHLILRSDGRARGRERGPSACRSDIAEEAAPQAQVFFFLDVLLEVHMCVFASQSVEFYKPLALGRANRRKL